MFPPQQIPEMRGVGPARLGQFIQLVPFVAETFKNTVVAMNLTLKPHNSPILLRVETVGKRDLPLPVPSQLSTSP